jgi:transcriptional regulator with XRE-family HTH domain
MVKLCHKGTKRASVVVPQVTYIVGGRHVTMWPMSKRGHHIKEWRKHRGLTQDQLADRIGINRAYLSKIESGKRRYDQPFLEAAAEVLNCEPADLIIRDPSDPDGIWSIWDQLKPVEKSQVVEIAKTIKRTGTDG